MDKLDFSKPDQLQTRDGRQVRIYATVHGGEYPIVGAVEAEQNRWFIETWRADGRCDRESEHRHDLVQKQIQSQAAS